MLSNVRIKKSFSHHRMRKHAFLELVVKVSTRITKNERGSEDGRCRSVRNVKISRDDRDICLEEYIYRR